MKYEEMRTKLFFIFFLFSVLIFTCRAETAVKFKAIGAEKVVLGKPFQIYFTTNAEGTNFKLSEIVDFDILAGPFEFKTNSNSLTGDKVTPKVINKYTYTLLAKRTGTFSIPAASINIKGKKYYSNGLRITVLPEDKENKSTGKNINSDNKTEKWDEEFLTENLFIRTIVSKTKIFEQETINLTYRLYSRLDVANFAPKSLPDFDSFLKNEIKEKPRLGLEHYNGKNYNTVDLYQIILRPQHSGIFSISDASFEIDIRMKNGGSRDIFDYSEAISIIKQHVSAPDVQIEVVPLPQEDKPINFGAAVGDFKMSSSISDTVVAQNEAVTMKIKITGTGNLRMIRTPKPRFSDSFESYDPKVTHNIKTLKSGTTGEKIIEYLIIPRQEGEFIIPPISISYFDLKENEYTSLWTEEHHLRVLEIDEENVLPQGVNSTVEKEEVKQLGEDIRHIYSKNFKTYKLDRDIKIGTVSSLMMYLIPLMIALIIFLFLDKNKKENEDITLFRNKKANKIARKHLKVAQTMLQKGENDEFYNELSKGIWTYLSYKLSIPMAELTKEKISEELQTLNIPKTIIEKIVIIIDACEFARYSPSSHKDEKMELLFNESVDIISLLEKEINKQTKIRVINIIKLNEA